MFKAIYSIESMWFVWLFFFGTFANCCQMRTLILFLYHVCITLDARMHPKSLLNSCDLHFSGFGWFCCTPCSFYYLSITIYSIHLHWYLRTEIDRMNERLCKRARNCTFPFQLHFAVAAAITIRKKIKTEPNRSWWDWFFFILSFLRW